MAALFKSTKLIEAQIDEFLDAVSQGALVFKQGIRHFLDNDAESLAANLKTIRELESNADSLRRRIENHLYTHSLIPENRGDVLGLLESMDSVVDTAKSSLLRFDVEKPDIEETLHRDFISLSEHATESAESIVLASRAFFRDPRSVTDHLHKVYFFEKEADKIAERLSRQIFTREIELSQKMHLLQFVRQVDFMADCAQQVADRLTIYAIKRNV